MKPIGIAKMMPSIRSNNPPCPGRISLVSLTFALRFKYEINKSPICDVKEISNVTTINMIKSIFGKSSIKNGNKDSEKTKEPIDPEIVFFGLIFVNFLPLKILPITKPPISDNTDINIE